MRTLDEIALSYNTDKSSMYHNYTKLYSLYFEQIRYEKLRILEIGIDKGYSLKTWREYFLNSEIVGIDIIDLRHLEEEHINILQGDQSDTLFLKKVNDTYGPFDIIIDDGSHHNDHMKASFEFLFPLLREGGLYIVEDLHACYWGASHNTGEPVFIDLLKKLIDDVNSGGKSGVANIQRDSDDGWYNQKRLPPMTWWEKNVEFIHLYRSIVFIKKYPPSLEKFNPLNKNINYLTVGNIVLFKHHHSLIKRKAIKHARALKRIIKKILK